MKKKPYFQIGTDKDKKFIVEVTDKSLSAKKGFEISVQRKLVNLF